jgi:hypothetical protein
MPFYDNVKESGIVQKAVFACGVFFFMVYLFWNTGIHSDDYANLANVSQWSLKQLLSLDAENNPVYLLNFPSLYFAFSQFYFFGEHLYLYDIGKAVCSTFCFFCSYLFIRRFVNRFAAAAFAFLFVLFPTHDATNYWVIGQYAILTPALAMLAHDLLSRKRFISGSVASMIASFSSYASPPYILGLSVIFLLQKKIKAFLCYTIPMAGYILFYGLIRHINTGGGDQKTPGAFDLGQLFNSFLIQVGSCIDAMLGPSFWLKCYAAAANASILSYFIAAGVGLITWMTYRHRGVDSKSTLLITALLVTLVLSLGMFALTGAYPQIAFNLGNRVTVYAALFFSFLIVSMCMTSRLGATLLVLASILVVLGISNHWKDWNHQQKQLLQRLFANEEVQKVASRQRVFVAYHQFSKLGEMDHIEFFTDFSVLNGAPKVYGYGDYAFAPLNHYCKIDNGELVYRKFGNRFPVGSSIPVYDTKKDLLEWIPRENLEAFIQRLPGEKRHWIQLLSKDSWPVRMLLHLMPRMAYAFE